MQLSVTLFGGLRHYLPPGSSFNKCKLDVADGASLETLLGQLPIPADKPFLVLVSFDGFRWDYAGLADTPNMDRMAREGLRAEALQPAFPTVTFPNHFSIATGVPPNRGLMSLSTASKSAPSRSILLIKTIRGTL